jgi:hypothetical protein
MSNLLNYFWNLQHKIENKFHERFNKNYSIQLEFKQTSSMSFFDIIMQQFFWEILTLIFTISFWYFYFKSISFNTFDALQIIWLINAPLWSIGLIILILIDLYKAFFYFKNYFIFYNILRYV